MLKQKIMSLVEKTSLVWFTYEIERFHLEEEL